MKQPEGSDVKVFQSAAEALAYLSSLVPDNHNPRDYFIFRGEANLHETMLPSVHRVPADKLLSYTTLVHGLATHFWSDYLEASLILQSDGAYYKGKPLVDPSEIEQVRSSPSFLDVEEQFQGLLQHYGWPTPWIDVTFDPKVAVFFASLDYAKQNLITTGFGYVFYWSKSEIRTKVDWFKPIVDLRPMANTLNDILRIEAIRPSRQVAGALKAGMHEMLHEKFLRQYRHCVVFEREDAAKIVQGYHHYFPRDPLKDILESWERQYLRWCEWKAGERPQEDFAMLDAMRARVERNKRHSAEQSKRLGFAPDSIVRYQDCIKDLEYHGQFVRPLRDWMARVKQRKHMDLMREIWRTRDIHAIRLMNNSIPGPTKTRSRRSKAAKK
jgi:hypothetical protein